MTHLPTQLARKLINRANARGLLAVAICGAATLAITPASALADDDAASFWTQFAPSEDTRLIFVSSSEGNDNNSGFSPNEPVASLDKAYELLRDGYPDWMLLKRGDVWYDSFPRWKKSGRGINEKLVVGAYGDLSARPQIRPSGGGDGIRGWSSNTVSNVAFVGFHIEPHEREADQGGSGISWLNDSENILFEDLYIGKFKDNMNLNAYQEGTSHRNLEINGCVIVDSWSNGGHSQGVYAAGIDGFTIKNSVLDHNGWNLDNGAEPTIFNHNLYLQGRNDNVTVVNNVISDASSHGIHFRSGGSLTSNLFLLNPISIDVGGGTGSSVREGGVEYDIKNNLIMYGQPMSNQDQSHRGWGISVKNTKSGRIHGNILANAVATTHNVFALRLKDPADGTYGVGFHDLTVDNNYFVGWPGPLHLGTPTADQPYSNVHIRDNYVSRDLSLRGAPVLAQDCPPSGNLKLTGNYYSIANPTSTPFRLNNTNISFDEWTSLAEPGATYKEATELSRIQIDDFMAANNLPGDVHMYIDTMRSLSRQSPHSELSPANVYDWARRQAQMLD